MENDNWWTAPAETDDGRLIMVTGRADVARFRKNPKFSIRIEIEWPYDTAPGEATDRLNAILDRDPVAVMTGIFTGAGTRTWVFYTLSTHIFQNKLNEALADLPTLPLHIIAENDPRWEAYDEMQQFEVK